MKIIIVIFSACLFITIKCDSPCNNSCRSSNTSQTPEYYWKDYFGVIPSDAVPGGIDKTGNPTYIGQVYIKGFELLPATIYPGCTTVVASAYNKEMHTDKNVKILCSRYIEKFSWIITKNEETHLLTNCHLVIGGSEVEQTLNIGRVNHNGQTIIGKVFSHPLSNRGLWIPNNGQEAHFLTYEILTYNCAKSKDCNIITPLNIVPV